MDKNENFNFGGFGSALLNENKAAFNHSPATLNTRFGFAQSTPVRPPAYNSKFSTEFGAAQNMEISAFCNSSEPTTKTLFGFENISASGTPALQADKGLNMECENTFGQTSKSGGLFSENTNLNNTGRFGNCTASGSTSTQPQHGKCQELYNHMLTSVAVAPFKGVSSLIESLDSPTRKSEILLHCLNSNHKVRNAQSSRSSEYKDITTCYSSRVRARIIASSKMSNKGLFHDFDDPPDYDFVPPRNLKRLNLRPKSQLATPVLKVKDNQNLSENNHTVDGDEGSTTNNTGEVAHNKNDQQMSEEPDFNRKSLTVWRKSQLPQSTELAEKNFIDHESQLNSSEIFEDAFEHIVTEETHEAGVSVTSRQSRFSSYPEYACVNCFCKSSISNSVSSNNFKRIIDKSLSASLQINFERNPAEIKLRRHGYYTIPPLDELDKFVNGNSCIVPNFTIGRKGYGNVYFRDSFDIFGLDLDDIVYFYDRKVIIYPDDDKKPPVGQGLNRRAQVTLDKVWPRDKNTNQLISDPVRLAAMDYDGKLRRVSAENNTRFVEYRAETGSWVFKVKHFSKYGLTDSDEDYLAGYGVLHDQNIKKKSQSSKSTEPMANVNKQEESKGFNVNFSMNNNTKVEKREDTEGNFSYNISKMMSNLTIHHEMSFSQTSESFRTTKNFETKIKVDVQVGMNSARSKN